MYVEQLYTNCLSEAAYYIESDGEAVIIDPLRESAPYLALAEKRNTKIKYVFETHFHADFVSGHLELARKTGAVIVYGPGAKADYEVLVAIDEEIFKLGSVSIKWLHTPGHTLESSCMLLMDENKKPVALFTGDTVFAGDVGRPDLAVSDSVSKEDLAGLMYDAIQSKILTLPDDVIVYPGHGPGSACGKNISKEKITSIGEQKKSNYALMAKSKEDFVTLVTSGLQRPPQYFFMDASINKKGYEDTDTVIKRNCKGISLKEFSEEIRRGALVLDTRPSEEFEKSFIPGSLHISLSGQFAIWAGSLINPNIKIILICEEGREKETVLRLARIGYENVKGYLQGGINSWIEDDKSCESLKTVSVSEFFKQIPNGIQILDVRNENEVQSGKIPNAISIPLSQLEERMSELNKYQPVYVYCAGGYRSIIACSILKKYFFLFVNNVEGGMNNIKTSDVQLEIPSVII